MSQLEIDGDKTTTSPRRKYQRKLKSPALSENALIPTTPTVPVPVETGPDSMIRLALSSGRSMDEIGKLIDFRNAEIARLARLEFLAAKKEFTQRRDRIVKKNEADYGTTSSGKTGAKYKYEDLDAIDETVKWLAAELGFSWDWKTRYEGEYVFIKCILSHSGGHSESDEMRGKADTSGGKNFIQADASTSSYLMRYTLKKVLGLSTGRDDNDGQGGAKVQAEGSKNTKFNFQDLMKAVTAKKVSFDDAVKNYKLSTEQTEALKIAAESV